MQNNIVNLPSLITKLAKEAGVEPAVARRFLHQLFTTVESEVSAGNKIEINGVGTFAPRFDFKNDTNGLNAENPVYFLPDSDLAEKINEPFSAFTPVEINDGAEKEMMDASKNDETDSVIEPVDMIPEQKNLEEPVVVADEQPIAPTPIPEQEEIPVVENNNLEESHDKVASTVETIESAEFPDEVTSPVVSVDAPPVILPSGTYAEHPVAPSADPSDTNMDFFVPQPAPSRKPSALWLVLGIMIGLILGLVGGFFAGKAMGRLELPESEESGYEESLYDDEVVNDVPNDSEILNDVQPVEAATEDVKPEKNEPVVENKVETPEPVYDKVTGTLAQLAGKHYGNKNYWVFIFDANPQLKNPDRIAPGTKVVIPSYDSFGEATRAKTDEKARKRIGEIMSKK